jgi:osmoprotectant transport system ATP-binding protein
MTVARNIGVVPRLLGWEQPRIDRRVTELLELVGLDPAEYADKRPRALSGGEAQRIGVARALAADPPVLLMDEPFGALDPLTRARLQQEFRNLQQLLGKTVVFVTHDVEEAVLLADRIVLMHEGKLEQHDTPERFWLRPASPFVERFFGGELSLEILSRHAVADIKLDPPDGEGLPAVAAEATLREALATMVTHGEDRVRIVGTDGGSLGTLAFCSLIAVLRAEA